MSVVVSRSTKRARYYFICAFVCLLFSICLLFVATRHLSVVASSASRLPSREDLASIVSRAVAYEVRAVISTVSLTTASSVVPPSVSGSGFASPKFVPVDDFCTWVSSSNHPRAIVNGVECGEGDFIEFGLVLSIRPNRIICRSEQGLVLLALRRSPPPPVSAVAETGGEGGGVKVPAPSW